MAARPPALAGLFYPADPAALRAEVRRHLGPVEALGPPPKMLVVPHAGYVYSGPVAAHAYARLRSARGRITRVVLAGPCHRVAVRGLALPDAAAFSTPLGEVPLDLEAMALARTLEAVTVFDATHAQEHSLEVQLPFLQEVLGSFELVPLVVGQASATEVAAVLEALWGGSETLIVISTDLSHFHDYDTAEARDARTCAAIEALAPERLQRDDACGRVPLMGALQLARRRGMGVETLDRRNSGDTGGDRRRVVGYGAWALYETP